MRGNSPGGIAPHRVSGVRRRNAGSSDVAGVVSPRRQWRPTLQYARSGRGRGPRDASSAGLPLFGTALRFGRREYGDPSRSRYSASGFASSAIVSETVSVGRRRILAPTVASRPTGPSVPDGPPSARSRRRPTPGGRCVRGGADSRNVHRDAPSKSSRAARRPRRRARERRRARSDRKRVRERTARPERYTSRTSSDVSKSW